MPGHYDQRLRECGEMKMVQRIRRLQDDQRRNGTDKVTGNATRWELLLPPRYLPLPQDRWNSVRRGLGRGGPPAAGANSAASRRMASATLPRGSSSRTGLPLLTEMGTERDEGMVRSTEVPRTFSTSGRRRPTRESARFTTTRMRPGGKRSRSMVCMVSLRFLMLGTSSVASSAIASDSSKAASTWSVMAAGVSTTTWAKLERSSLRMVETALALTVSAIEG